MCDSGRRVLLFCVAALAAIGCGPTRETAPVPTPSAAGVPAKDALEFQAIGDWGRRGSALQRRVADAMSVWAAAHPPRFVLSLGDNFYEFGVSSVTDTHWRQSFEDVYAARSLRVPWWVALGNHDYRGSVQAQIDYAKTSDRWRMPARYYTFTEPVTATVRAQFFVLDTTPFLDTYRSIISATKVEGQDAHAQVAWLEKELAASTAEWKIVVGHHPIRSCGPHGDSDELVRDVLPLLEKYRVGIYVNGHDHGLQHLHDGAVDFFTSGAGSEVTRVTPDARTIWADATSGFMAFTIQTDGVSVKAIDGKGTLLHAATVLRPLPPP